MEFHSEGERTQAVFNVYEYERGLGQANPTWQTVPEYYYPLECKEVCFYIFFVVAVICSTLGIFIGFLFWAVQSTEQYIRTWTIVLCTFIVVALVLLWMGGKDRRRQEKQLIAETNRRQEEMMKGKK